MKKRHKTSVRFNDAQREHLLHNGGISKYIRKLIDKDMKENGGNITRLKSLESLMEYQYPTRNVEDNFSIIAHELAAIGKRLERLEKNK